MADQEATESLVRHAVVSPFADVRSQAAGFLRYRPFHDFVPLLVNELRAPIETLFQIERDDNGVVHYSHLLYQEGPFTDRSHQLIRSAYQMSESSQITPAAGSDPRTVAILAAGAARSAIEYRRDALEMERGVAERNAAIEALNERIVPLLVHVSRQDLGSDPQAWWKWWQEYNDHGRPYVQPVYETQDVRQNYVFHRTPRPTLAATLPGASLVATPVLECFVRATPVWTKTGRRSIESIELGDLVLAQDVNTGELSFKPVVRRSVRPPSRILKVEVGNEELLMTRGHPLWVSGSGWRMAKEVGDGAVLYGLHRPFQVESIGEVVQQEAYNLVVAEFNTYFVGHAGILVHDNTPRRPTRATVPGRMAN
jgi:hypothetical protein